MKLPSTSISLPRFLLACALALPLLAHAALSAYRVQDAQGRRFNAEVQGSRLYLLDKGKKSLAPDGSYKTDGGVLKVRGGVLLNPQPEPPGVAQSSKKPGNPGEIRGFNPQPDPPGDQAKGTGKPGNPGETHGFNPQPDPPGDSALGKGALAVPAAQGVGAK